MFDFKFENELAQYPALKEHYELGYCTKSEVKEVIRIIKKYLKHGMYWQ